MCKRAVTIALYLRYLPGSGAHSRACREIRAVRMVSAGVHSFFRMSRQIAPVYELIFGCQIFVSNFIYSHKQKQTLKSWLSAYLNPSSQAVYKERLITPRSFLNILFTYLGWLEWVICGNDNINDKSSFRITCVRLKTSKSNFVNVHT